MNFDSAYLIISTLLTEGGTSFDQASGRQETSFSSATFPDLDIRELEDANAIRLVSPVFASDANAKDLLGGAFLGAGSGPGAFAYDESGQLVLVTEINLDGLADTEFEAKLGQHMVFAALSEVVVPQTQAPQTPPEDALMVRV